MPVVLYVPMTLQPVPPTIKFINQPELDQNRSNRGTLALIQFTRCCRGNRQIVATISCFGGT